jgi:hypothetical protein
LRGSRNAGKYLMFDGELANVTGNPAMSVPFGFDTDGLPIAIAVLGRSATRPPSSGSPRNWKKPHPGRTTCQVPRMAPKRRPPGNDGTPRGTINGPVPAACTARSG